MGDAIEKIDEGILLYCEKLKNVYYTGSASDFWGIDISQYDEGNDELFQTIYFYVEDVKEVPNDGWDYWHYVDGVPTIWE